MTGMANEKKTLFKSPFKEARQVFFHPCGFRYEMCASESAHTLTDG